MEGKRSRGESGGAGLSRGVKNPLPAGRYHPLSIKEGPLPDVLVANARTSDGEIMGIHHRLHPTYGVQFHPESVLTPSGKRLLRNFLQMAGEV